MAKSKPENAGHSNARNRLLREHPASSQGTWEIRGEDPNCDLGGSHHQPKLEVVTGTYKNVVEYALTLPGFFNWGSGGSINKLETPKNLINVDVLNDPKVLELEDERRELQERLKDIETELKSLLTRK